MRQSPRYRQKAKAPPIEKGATVPAPVRRNFPKRLDIGRWGNRHENVRDEPARKTSELLWQHTDDIEYTVSQANRAADSPCLTTEFVLPETVTDDYDGRFGIEIFVLEETTKPWTGLKQIEVAARYERADLKCGQSLSLIVNRREAVSDQGVNASDAVAHVEEVGIGVRI